MSLTDTFVRFAKASKPSGDKHCDGGSPYIYVQPQGKYWRLDYRYLNKRKTMALGTYQEVALATARKRPADADVLLAYGIDPAEARREEREARLIPPNHTFESVALTWLAMQAKMRSASTREKVLAWLAAMCVLISASGPSPRSSRATYWPGRRKWRPPASDDARAIKRIYRYQRSRTPLTHLAPREQTTCARYPPWILGNWSHRDQASTKRGWRHYTRMRRGQAVNIPHTREWCPGALTNRPCCGKRGGQKHSPDSMTPSLILGACAARLELSTQAAMLPQSRWQRCQAV